MKRVLCLYRVSTIGQVDHDDIPMQRVACREFIDRQKDWTLVDEVLEKGVSGYKTKTAAVGLAWLLQSQKQFREKF